MPPYPEDHLPGGDKRSPLALSLKVGDADPTKTHRIWNKVRNNLHRTQGPHRPAFLAEMQNATAILPNYWQLYPSDLAKYLRQELCDLHMSKFLEDKKVLNWCPGFTKLYPLNATGDGNCLLHAISLALWGVEDTDLWLRKVLYSVMRGDYAGANEHRWRRERNQFDTTHIPGQGFRYNTKEWSAEWQIVVDISSPERRLDQTMGLPYECLEEFHIFVMANILRRPIIILAENMWRDAAGKSLQPLNFSGIYLPLGWDPKDCFRHPILLGYHHQHFSPLLCTGPPTDKEVKDVYCVSLVDHEFERFPIHFLEEGEEGRVNQLLQQYLTCETVGFRDRPVLCARLATDYPKEELDVFQSYLNLAEMRYRMYTEEQHNPENAEALKAAGVMSATSTQQLNEKIAAGSDPKHTGHPRRVSTEDPSAVQTGGSLSGNDVFKEPTEDSVCISSTALQSSRVKAPSMNLQHMGYFGRTSLACTTPGCHYIRALESDEYCERCYKARSSAGKEAFKRCRVDSCLNGGDRRYDGFCQVCYDQSTFMNDDILVAARPTNLQDLSTSPKFSGLSARGPVHFDPPTVQDGNGMEVEEYKTSGSTLDTNVVNEFRVGSKQCITPGCDFTGNPNYGGLCSKCSQEKAGAGEQSTGGAEPLGFLDASPPREIAVTVGKKKCLMPECALTGHPEKLDLCSGCFNKQAEIGKAAGLSLKTMGEKPSPIPDTDIPEFSRRFSTERQKQLLESASHPCRTANCEMYAHPSQNGFCSACYKKSITGRSSPHDFSRGSSSPKHAKGQEVSTFRPILQFTVQKNMCAIPGCNGVRLQLGSGDLCRAHYQEISRRYSPTTSTSTPPGAITRAGMPSVGGRAQPSAPPQSIYASRPGHRSPGILREVQQATEPSQMARASSMQFCAHPGCNNLAVPPSFVACRRCLDFVDKVNQVEAAIKSVRGEGATAEATAVRRAPEDDEMSPIAFETEIDPNDPPTETVRNLDIHEKLSSGIKGHFQYDYVKRVKCKAKGGCPFNSYGNPEYGDRCATCFDREVVVPLHKTSSSSSAPLKKASRSQTLPPPSPRSQSAVISSPSTASRVASRPPNYQKCSRRDCLQQANVQIMEGYCSQCYPAYKTREDKKKSRSSSGLRERSAPPSGTSSKREKPVMRDDDLIPISAARCRTEACQNYGNSHSRGYCNGCFQKLMN